MSVNVIEFNNNFIGLREFSLGDKVYVGNLSIEIFNLFGFKDSDDYIDCMPDNRCLDRDPFIRIVKQEQPFTTIAYTDSRELPYGEHTLLFTFREIDIGVVNYILKNEFENECLFLV